MSKRLFATRYRVVASPSYLTDNPISAPQELTGRDCLLFALPDFRSRWRFRSETVEEEVAISGKFVMSNALALRRAAVAGLGPALLADWLVDHDVASGGLVDLFPDHCVAAAGFDTGAWMLWAGRDYMPRKTRAVMQFLEDAFREGASMTARSPVDDISGGALPS